MPKSNRKYKRILPPVEAESDSSEESVPDTDSSHEHDDDGLGQLHNSRIKSTPSPGKRKNIKSNGSPRKIKKLSTTTRTPSKSNRNKRTPVQVKRRKVVPANDTASSNDGDDASEPSEEDEDVEDEVEMESATPIDLEEQPESGHESNYSSSSSDGMSLDSGDKLLLVEMYICIGCGALFDEPCPCDQFLARAVGPNPGEDDDINMADCETLPLVTPPRKSLSPKNGIAVKKHQKSSTKVSPSPSKTRGTPNKRKSVSPAKSGGSRSSTSTPSPKKPKSSTSTPSPKKAKSSPVQWKSPRNWKKLFNCEPDTDSDDDVQEGKNGEAEGELEEMEQEDNGNSDKKLEVYVQPPVDTQSSSAESEVERSEGEDENDLAESEVQKPVDTQSSSSESEVEGSESEDENELENSLIPGIRFQQTQPVDTLNMLPHLQNYPSQSESTYVEEKIFSKVEFSIELYKLNARGKRIEYPEPDFVNFLKTLNISERRYDPETKLFLFPMKKNLYEKIISCLGNSGIVRQSSTLPDGAEHPEELGTLTRAVRALSMYRMQNIQQENFAMDPKFFVLFSEFPSLENYQMEAIQFAISREGSCILADEQQMGKRVEALVVCKYFKEDDEWPFMITCASAKVDYWKTLLSTVASATEFGLGISPKRIKVVETEEECANLVNTSPEKYDVVIITYSLLLSKSKPLVKLIQAGVQYHILIVDESHRIKHKKTKTSRAMRHLIKRSERRLFLTSNPSFAVPRELFYQLHCVNPKVFKDYEEFANLYCGWEMNPRTMNVGVSRSWRHAKNLNELKHILFGTLIYRNFRSDVPRSLPNLVRERINLDSNLDERTRRLLGSVNIKLIKECLYQLENNTDTKQDGGIFKWFRRSGTAKLMEVCKYLDSVDYKENKVVIYAHHKDVIKGIEKLLGNKGVNYVKIEGDYETRRDLSLQFHQSKVRVALLSLRRSTHDINLQCADLVIFAELLWVPDNLFRNENRTFKFNSKITADRTITIKYLFASEHDSENHDLYIDESLWEMLRGKMDVLEKLGLLKDDFMNKIQERDFHGQPSSIIDDLELSEVDDRDSSDEYSPSESGNEEDISEEYESDDSSSEDLAINSDSNNNNDDDENGETEIVAQESDNSNPSSDEKENEAPAKVNENESSEHTEFLGETDTEDELGNDDDDSDLDGFVASNSSDNDSEEDADYDPNKKKSRKKKKPAKPANDRNHKESEEGTESESDDEDYEVDIKKATKKFVF